MKNGRDSAIWTWTPFMNWIRNKVQWKKRSDKSAEKAAKWEGWNLQQDLDLIESWVAKNKGAMENGAMKIATETFIAIRKI